MTHHLIFLGRVDFRIGGQNINNFPLNGGFKIDHGV